MEDITATHLLHLYNSGQRNFKNVDIKENESFQNENLSNCIFESSFLSMIDFRSCNLRGSTFRSCNLKCSDFRHADLTKATIERCLLEATAFKESRTKGLIFTENYYYG